MKKLQPQEVNVLTYPNVAHTNFGASSDEGAVIQVDIGGHLPFPTGSKQFSGNFGNLLFLAVLTSVAILRA